MSGTSPGAGAIATQSQGRLYALVDSSSARAPGGELLLLAQGAALAAAVEGLPEGVYTAFRTFGGARFVGLDQHLARTQRSMDLLGWTSALDEQCLRSSLNRAAAQWVSAAAQSGSAPDTKIRVHVVRDPVAIGAVRARVFLLLTPLQEVPPAFLREGVGLELAPELRRERPRVKTTDFMRLRRPRPLERQDAFDHLLVDDRGGILEGSSSNFYGVVAGSVWTRNEGVLEGITRSILARLALEIGVGWHWRSVSLDQLRSLDEAFLSSSTRGVVPVVKVAGTPIAGGSPGSVTRRLAAAYVEYVARAAGPA
jgi:branched-subunit amino acid aminotransferase/4-amino-4-deoxychorismate lyase